MINSYPSIYNLGHKAIIDLLKGPVIAEEKIDGSQFSFKRNGAIDEIECRSKGAVVNTVVPEGMFAQGVKVVQELGYALPDGLTFRGEYLAKPKHNVLCYSRIPNKNIVIFDINDGEESYLDYDRKAQLAADLGLEVVPILFRGMLTDVTKLRELLERESFLGGQKVEGVVIKPLNYDLFGRDKKVLMGKFVSEAYKEVHSAEWKTLHATKGPGDVINIMAAQFATPARWEKAIIHLKEKGEIEDSNRDIGKLIAEVPADVLKECEGEIREQLFKWAWPQLRRKLTGGLPEWYKQRLLTKQFESSLTNELD
jgi:hypothetical protein